MPDKDQVTPEQIADLLDDEEDEELKEYEVTLTIVVRAYNEDDAAAEFRQYAQTERYEPTSITEVRM